MRDLIDQLATNCCCGDTYELVSTDPRAKAEVQAMYTSEYEWAVRQLERSRQIAV